MAKPHMCSQENLSKNLSGKVYAVTGANSGIGLITADQLAKQGAQVVLGCRRMSAGQDAADAINAKGYPGQATAMALDLGSLSSVRTFAADFKKAFSRLDGLINNAGVMNTPQGTTTDGFETQFGTNHLGHFVLTNELTDLLEATDGARVVNVSSCYHDMAVKQEGKIDFDDPNFKKRPYNGWLAYAQSKLANLLHAKELAARLGDKDVTAVSVHPGWVRTNLAKDTMPIWVQNYVARPMLKMMGMIEPWEGAQTSLHAILDDDVPNHNGAYFSQLGMYRDKAANKGGWPLHSPNPNATAENAQKLWQLSETLTSQS